jgi:hypothetical protein
MNSEAAIKNFHSAIINAASQKLGRDLTIKETKFITSKGGFIALEMILDTVKSESKPKRCIKISNRITPTLPSPLRGGGLGWGGKGHRG